MFHIALTFPAILNAQLLIVTLTRFNILEGPYPKMDLGMLKMT